MYAGDYASPVPGQPTAWRCALPDAHALHLGDDARFWIILTVRLVDGNGRRNVERRKLAAAKRHPAL